MTCEERILIVEDEPDLRETLRDLLEMEGYKVEAATNGREALELLQDLGIPCLILLDLMMPVMDGWEFLETLDARPGMSPANLPIAIVSAAADVSDVQKRYGCLTLKKPVRLEQLLALAEEHCECRR